MGELAQGTRVDLVTWCLLPRALLAAQFLKQLYLDCLLLLDDHQLGVCSNPALVQREGSAICTRCMLFSHSNY